MAESSGTAPRTTLTSSFWVTSSPICPDLLRIEQLGEADGWRGKAVLLFFRLLKKITGV